MKRVIIACVLLVIVIVGCFLSYSWEKQRFGEYLALTDQAEQHFLEGDIEAALSATETLADSFSANARYASFFLSHTALTEVEKSIQALPLILKHGEHKDFTAEVKRCQLMLQRLWDQQKPTWENVL